MIIEGSTTLTVPHLEGFKQQPNAKLKNQIYANANQKGHLFLYLVNIPFPEKKILITTLDMPCVN